MTRVTPLFECERDVSLMELAARIPDPWFEAWCTTGPAWERLTRPLAGLLKGPAVSPFWIGDAMAPATWALEQAGSVGIRLIEPGYISPAFSTLATKRFGWTTPEIAPDGEPAFREMDAIVFELMRLRAIVPIGDKAGLSRLGETLSRDPLKLWLLMARDLATLEPVPRLTTEVGFAGYLQYDDVDDLEMCERMEEAFQERAAGFELLDDHCGCPLDERRMYARALFFRLGHGLKWLENEPRPDNLALRLTDIGRATAIEALRAAIHESVCPDVAEGSEACWN